MVTIDDTQDILQFRGEFSWLSNFHYFETPMNYGRRLTFPSVEHFYVAMKTKDFNTRMFISKHPAKGLKKLGKSFELREDWDNIKLDVMDMGLRYKFSEANPTLRNKLIATGVCHIQEGNWWNDKFWGVCLKTGEGDNNLGKLIMKIRSEIGFNKEGSK